jgi:hypothetical protein
MALITLIKAYPRVICSFSNDIDSIMEFTSHFIG